MVRKNWHKSRLASVSVIFPHSANQSTHLWCCRSCHRFFNSLLLNRRTATIYFIQQRNENVNREVIYASTLHYIKDTDQSKRALILALCMITVGVRETLFDVYIICREFIMLVFWTTFTLKKGGSLDIINQFLTFWPCYFFSGDRSRLGFPWLSLCRSVCAVWPFKFCAWWTWFCYNGHWSSSTAQCSFVSVKLFRAQHFFSRLFRLLFILV